MRFIFCCLILLFSFHSVNAETQDRIYLDDMIKPLPEGSVLWRREETVQPESAFETYMGLLPISDNLFIYFGKIGHDEKPGLTKGIVSAYDREGQKLWQYSDRLDGEHVFYSAVVKDGYIILVGPEHNENKTSSVVSIYVLNAEDGTLINKSKVHHDDGFLDSPRLVRSANDELFLAARLMARPELEETVLYNLNVDAASINAQLIDRFNGWTHDIELSDEDIFAAGSHHIAQLVKINKQNGQSNVFYRNERADKSDYSSVFVDGSRLFTSGQYYSQNGINGHVTLLSSEGKVNWQKILLLEQQTKMLFRDMRSLGNGYFVTTMQIEPIWPISETYGVLLFFDNEGTFCSAYRLGEGAIESLFVTAAEPRQGELYISGARADNKKTENYKGTVLWSKRFMAYNALAMALDMTRLERCE